MNAKHVIVPLVVLILTGCGRAQELKHPSESYLREPAAPITADQNVFAPEHLVSFYDVPGEYGHALEGGHYGLKGMSIITTDTYPGGGPPLHTHKSVEAHVLEKGHYRTLVDGKEMDVRAPAIVRIPAGVPHTFMNTSDEIIHVIGILPTDKIHYEELGPNPLIENANKRVSTSTRVSGNMERGQVL